MKKKMTQEKDPHGPWRDTLRIHQLQSDGWSVFSVSRMSARSEGYFSDKHVEASLCKTNSKTRSFMKILQQKVGEISKKPFFDVLSLDYIRMYTSYARSCWTTYFWSTILIELFNSDFISSTTPIYISNFEDIVGAFTKAQKELLEKGYYLRKEICEPDENPLFNVTGKVSSTLERVGDPNTNAAYLRSRNNQKLKNHMFRIFLEAGIGLSVLTVCFFLGQETPVPNKRQRTGMAVDEMFKYSC